MSLLQKVFALQFSIAPFPQTKRSNGCNVVRSDFENVTFRNVKWTESGQKAVTNGYRET